MSRIIQCDGSPVEGCLKAPPCEKGLPPQRLHDWAILVDRDGYRCDRCGLTYLGGPTIEVTDPAQKLRDRGFQ